MTMSAWATGYLGGFAVATVIYGAILFAKAVLIANQTTSDLWTIVDCGTWHPVCAFDYDLGSNDKGMIVYMTREAAEKSAEYQGDLYGLDCEARRLDDVFAKNDQE
jgi:hypothetical protein